MTDEENTAYFELENLAFDLKFKSINQDEIKQGNNIYELLDLLKKLQNENEYLKTHIIYPEIIKLNFIPKQVIRDKIEKLEKQRDNVKIFKNIDEYDRCIGKIEMLQELLVGE